MNNQEKPMLDLQFLDRHYFWNERPLAVAMELRNHFEKVEVSSYINDDFPSLLINNEYQVYLPNSIERLPSENHIYGVVRDSELQLGITDNWPSTSTLEGVIEIVRDMIEQDRTLKRSEVVHRMQMIMDDLKMIKKRLSEHELTLDDEDRYGLDTSFNNIEIACDLDSDEYLSWKLYSIIYNEIRNTN